MFVPQLPGIKTESKAHRMHGHPQGCLLSLLCLAQSRISTGISARSLQWAVCELRLKESQCALGIQLGWIGGWKRCGPSLRIWIRMGQEKTPALRIGWTCVDHVMHGLAEHGLMQNIQLQFPFLLERAALGWNGFPSNVFLHRASWLTSRLLIVCLDIVNVDLFGLNFCPFPEQPCCALRTDNNDDDVKYAFHIYSFFPMSCLKYQVF